MLAQEEAPNDPKSDLEEKVGDQNRLGDSVDNEAESSANGESPHKNDHAPKSGGGEGRLKRACDPKQCLGHIQTHDRAEDMGLVDAIDRKFEEEGDACGRIGAV